MARIVSVTVHSEYPEGANVSRVYKLILEDNILVQHIYYSQPVIVNPLDDGLALAAQYLENLADSEIDEALALTEHPQYESPEKVAQWQTQVDYDRRLLGRLMLVQFTEQFHTALPFYEAQRTRNGNNTNARADNLGVPRADYGEIEARFNEVSGVDWFVVAQETKKWDTLPMEFE